MEKMVSKLEISPVQISLRNTLVKHDWYKCKEDATNTQYEDVEVPALTNHKILNKHKVCNKRAVVFIFQLQLFKGGKLAAKKSIKVTVAFL